MQDREATHGEIHHCVLDLLRNACARITPTDLQKQILAAYPQYHIRQIRNALRELADAGHIAYTNHFNTTHVELNVSSGFAVSPRIVLKAQSQGDDTHTEKVNVLLDDGLSFGAGDHPTTRMMLQGLDFAMQAIEQNRPYHHPVVLDVGSGTGVLSVAAALLHARRVVAVDIDPLARAETRRNASLNHVNAVINVVPDINHPNADPIYDVILANLRPPTLKALFPRMLARSTVGSIWVLSGFRSENTNWVLQNHLFRNWIVLWQTESCSWGALALQFA